MTLPEIALSGLTGLLGVVMVVEAGIKFRGGFAADFERYGYPEWARLATAGLEFLGGLGLLAGLVVGDPVALGGALVVAAVLAGALATHVRVGDSATEMAPAAVLLALTVGVAAATAGLLG